MSYVKVSYPYKNKLIQYLHKRWWFREDHHHQETPGAKEMNLLNTIAPKREFVCSRTSRVQEACYSMSFVGYVAVCVQLYCVSCHCLTLHVSAYMAIFKCVVYFLISICLKESALLVICLFFSPGHIARFHLCFSVPFFFVNFVDVSCVCVCLLAFSFVVCLFCFWRSRF
jgi:hypothetical protein